MLDIVNTTKFFHLIGYGETTEEENFTKVFLLLEGLDKRSLATLMIIHDVKWELVKTLCELSEIEFRLLEVLIDLERFNQSYMCMYEECEQAVDRFLTMCDTELAQRCLHTMRELAIPRIAPLQETSTSPSK